MLTVGARFWSKVDIRSYDGCWAWTGCLAKGYGQFQVGPGRRIGTHRWAYEEIVGPIPEGLQLDHLCRVRECCNPAHLEPVTRSENILRGASPTAVNARKTHCPRGHEYTPENTYRRPNGVRECLQCKQRLQVEWWAERASAAAYDRLPNGGRA